MVGQEVRFDHLLKRIWQQLGAILRIQVKRNTYAFEMNKEIFFQVFTPFTMHISKFSASGIFFDSLIFDI